MPLDSLRVDRIHTRLLARYGSRWTAMWANVEPGLVKADWAYLLDRMPDGAIAYALDHLPEEFPPTAALFRNLCIAGMPDEVKALPAPKADPARVEAELRRLAELQGIMARQGPREWAYRLQEREKSGERLTLFQRDAWRTALETIDLPESGGHFNPVPPEALPPGMRS